MEKSFSNLMGLLLWSSLLMLAAAEDVPVDPLFTNGIQQVWQGNTMLYEKVFGHQHRESNTPVTRESQFRIGSNSKTFTTMAILQFADQGVLNVHDNISDYLNAADLAAWRYDGNTYCPRFNGSAVCEQLTFYDLMSMRSGLVNALGCFKYDPGTWQTQYCVPESYFMFYTGSSGETISAYSNVPLNTRPGSVYDYNNGNTIMLSYFVEKFSGLKLEEYMSQKIFLPLGMKSISQDNLAQQLKASPSQVSNYYDYTDLSRSYEYFAYGNAASTEVNQGVQTGAGGFFSTASDMARFYTSLFVSKNASGVISDASLAMMIEPLSITQDHPVYGCECFGLGFFMVYKPPCDLSSVENRDYIYYQGVINAATATVLMLDNWAEPAVDPIMSVAFRNNVIMDTTEADWNSALLDVTGNLTSIFATYGMTKYGDSWMPALNNAQYFQQNGEPYPSPSPAPTSCEDGDDEDGISLTAGELAACVIVPTAVTVLSVIVYVHIFVVSKLDGIDVNRREKSVVMSPMGNN